MYSIIHIGYPKTATTTLQKMLFNQEKFYYIGKNSNEKILDYILLGKKFVNVHTDKIIIVSDETLIMDEVKEQIDRIKEIFKNVKIVVSIRNHSDLIFSWYTQILPSLKTPTQYIEEFLNENKHSDFFNSFYFYKQIKKYSDVFGKENIKIIFYEDLKNNNDEYFKSWANLLEIDLDEVKGCLKQDLNKKDKNKKGYFRNIDLSLILGNLIYKSGIFYIYKKFLRDIGFKKLFSFVYKKSEKIVVSKKEIKYLDEILKSKIKNHFKEDTYKLIKEFDLDEKKLKKYNYIY